MNTNAEFDLKTFQSEVFKDFNNLKANKGLTRLHSIGYERFANNADVDTSFSLVGIFIRIFVSFFIFLGSRVKKIKFTKPEFIEKEKKATEIVENPKIKKIICLAFTKQLPVGLFTEAMHAKVVRIVTSTLTKSEIAEKFVIEKDVQLFAIIILKILRRKKSYCS